MWIIFGTKESARRVPNGAQVVHRCGSCGEVTTFYEKEITETFRLYFIDVYDYKRHRAMQCGACGATYVTDEIKQHAEERNLGASIGKRLEQGGDAITRAASVVGDEITGLAAKLVGRPAPPKRSRSRDEEAPDRGDDREDRLDEDLADLDESEAKFRQLEAEDDARRGRK